MFETGTRPHHPSSSVERKRKTLAIHEKVETREHRSV